MTSKVSYLLDTNILVHYARRSRLQQVIESRHGLLTTETIPLISYVSEGEMASFVLQNGWGRDKQEQLAFLLSTFRRIPIETSSTLAAYAQIDVYSRDVGIKMGKNDLWIAATAQVTAATLLTTDKDFDHLDGLFLSREWIEPTL